MGECIDHAALAVQHLLVRLGIEELHVLGQHAVVVLRIAGFAATSAATRSQGAVVAIYAVPLLAIALSSVLIFHGPAVRAWNARLAGLLRRRRLGRA